MAKNKPNLISVLNSEKKYYGKYVALNEKGEVVAYSKDSGKAIDKARERGVNVPAIVFIRDPKVTYIFKVA